MTGSTSRWAPALVAAALLLTASAGVSRGRAATGPCRAAADTAGTVERSGPEIDLEAVLVAPLSDLSPGAGTEGALQMSAGVGARAGGIWWLGSGIGVGAGGLWAPVDLDRQPSAAEGEPDGVDPGGKVGDGDYLVGTVELFVALPTVGREVEVVPYLLGGAGVRHLSVDALAGTDPGLDEATGPTGTVGGGFRTILSDHLLLRLEARDQVSSVEAGQESRVQHDLTVSVGLGVRP